MISSNKAQLTIKEKCTNINLKRLSRPGDGNNIHNRSKYSRQYQKLYSATPISIIRDNETLQVSKYRDNSRSMTKMQYYIYPVEDLKSAYCNS